ncbi:conjugative transposon protein TraM [Phocaeicola dorei]
MRLLQDVTLSGMKIPANTLFYGVATFGSQPPRCGGQQT